jgi:hypothetical protein
MHGRELWLPPCLLPWYLRTPYGTQIIPYVQKTDWPLRMGRQIDLEKRPGRPGDDALPLRESASPSDCNFNRSGRHAGGEPRAES